MSYEQTDFIRTDKKYMPPKSIYKSAMLVSSPVNKTQVRSHSAKSK